MKIEKTNITLRVNLKLVKKLRVMDINLSKFFNDSAETLIFHKEPYLNLKTNDLEFYKSESEEGKDV